MIKDSDVKDAYETIRIYCKERGRKCEGCYFYLHDKGDSDCAFELMPISPQDWQDTELLEKYNKEELWRADNGN